MDGFSGDFKSVHLGNSLIMQNFWYNLTESEIKNWMMAPYLIAFGKRQFANPLNIGVINNTKESIYAILGCEESEDETNFVTGSII